MTDINGRFNSTEKERIVITMRCIIVNKAVTTPRILLSQPMEDYFNEFDNFYHPGEVEKLNNIRKQLVHLRKQKTQFGPQKTEIETIDSPFNQKLGIVFRNGLEVAIRLTESGIEANVVKPLININHNDFTQSIVNSIKV
ncbi:hypothetical protein GCM10027347_17820 [Larkinella harenae]